MDEEVARLEMSLDGPSASSEEVANRLFREGLIPAVQQMVHLAAYGQSEKIRMDACKYVIERNIGKIADKVLVGDAWAALLDDITKNVDDPGAPREPRLTDKEAPPAEG